MGTTTKMAIPYPEATGLVKDGWEDMKDIATQVDAKSGLVLISTTSFSAVSSQALPANTFSSTFENYFIILYLTAIGTGQPTMSMRLRTGSTDASGANYAAGGTLVYQNSATVNSWRDFADTSINLGGCDAGYPEYRSWTINLLNPQKAVRTLYHVTTTGADATQVYGANKQGVHTLATSYDSANILISSSTMSGKVTVYGYNF